jgi:HKD family nuclease
MSIWRRSQAQLVDGLYDEVVTEALRKKLDALADSRAIELVDVGRETDIDDQLISMIRDAASFVIRSKSDPQAKLAIAHRLLEELKHVGNFREGENELRAEVLKRVATKVAGEPPLTARPRGSLLSSGLITNAHGDSVLDHLSTEFSTADRISLLCSFIKLSGLDKFRPLIERHRAMGRSLRVLTTTYMWATESKAIDLLHRLGAEIRISYDHSSTRLHAKAWIFHRSSEYSTAYVGSSNLSHHAQTEGLEWNVRIAQADQPDILDEMSSVFERYWNDADMFEPYDGSEKARTRLSRALTEPEDDRQAARGADRHA